MKKLTYLIALLACLAALPLSAATTVYSFTAPLAVSKGGTGVATCTAYDLIFAGTTSTGAFQCALGLGTSGQVLTSAGAGALPAWATPSASPGGSDTYVQFNDSGAFGGDAGCTYNKTTDSMTLAGGLTASGNASTFGSASDNTTLTCNSYGTCQMVFNSGGEAGYQSITFKHLNTEYFHWKLAPDHTVSFGNASDNGIAFATDGAATFQKPVTMSDVLKITPRATAPASCTAGQDIYTDTSGAFCACTATNTWTNMTPLTGACT